MASGSGIHYRWPVCQCLSGDPLAREYAASVKTFSCNGRIIPPAPKRYLPYEICPPIISFCLLPLQHCDTGRGSPFPHLAKPARLRLDRSGSFSTVISSRCTGKASHRKWLRFTTVNGVQFACGSHLGRGQVDEEPGWAWIWSRSRSNSLSTPRRFVTCDSHDAAAIMTAAGASSSSCRVWKLLPQHQNFRVCFAVRC